MENNVDINEVLKNKNNEMLLNKKRIDLDKAMESIQMFYNNYCDNYAIEINDQLCGIKNIDINSEQGEIIKKMTASFLNMITDTLNKTISEKTMLIKEQLNNMDDIKYNKVLNYMSLNIVNQISEFYLENVNMLINELVFDSDLEINKRISDYLSTIVYNKIINVLKDQFMYAIKLIDNNYEENNQIMEGINEKTIKQA